MGHLRQIFGLALRREGAIERHREEARLILGLHDHGGVDVNCALLIKGKDFSLVKQYVVQGLFRTLGCAPRKHIREILLEKGFEVVQDNGDRARHVCAATHFHVVVFNLNAHSRKINLD